MASLWAMSEGRGYPSDRLCKDADENYKIALDEIFFYAYSEEMEALRKKKK